MKVTFMSGKVLLLSCKCDLISEIVNFIKV